MVVLPAHPLMLCTPSLRLQPATGSHRRQYRGHAYLCLPPYELIAVLCCRTLPFQGDDVSRSQHIDTDTHRSSPTLSPPQFCKPALSLSRNKTELERSPGHWCDPKAIPRKALFLPLSSPQTAMWLLADGVGTIRVELHLSSCSSASPAGLMKAKTCFASGEAVQGSTGCSPPTLRAAEHTLPLTHPALHWGALSCQQPSSPFPAFVSSPPQENKYNKM